ncbi:MAG: type II toxin-antitoxin system RelE/ParE family toxin [Deltaproteobacteria bacterium]|nr:type II toxin-antitoxin system RelE/ParE family toxin [Deltaproteobacteria bacterium]MBW1911451.1 type II toxin-antitoxin system RelE/ParE family toxin [Deltaproteobacteria bacterium]
MPRFKKYVKKLPRHFQQVILDAVEDVLADTEVGEIKKGDLKGFRVHRFTMGRQLTLMAYKVENDSIVLYQVGPHENFYKSLKKYLKEIGD